MDFVVDFVVVSSRKWSLCPGWSSRFEFGVSPLGQRGGSGSGVQLGSSWPDNGWTMGGSRERARLPRPLPLLPGYFHRIVPGTGRMSPAFFLSASKGCGAGRERRGFVVQEAPWLLLEAPLWKISFLLCEMQPRKGILAFGDGFSVDRARVVTKECCKVPPVFLHSSCCCGWAELRLLSAAEEAELPRARK